MLTPNSASSAATSEMPTSWAIRTIISDEDTEYSTHRAGLRRRPRSATYRCHHAVQTSRWASADRARKPATASPVGMSKRTDGVERRCPGGPAM